MSVSADAHALESLLANRTQSQSLYAAQFGHAFHLPNDAHTLRLAALDAGERALHESFVRDRPAAAAVVEDAPIDVDVARERDAVAAALDGVGAAAAARSRGDDDAAPAKRARLHNELALVVQSGGAGNNNNNNGGGVKNSVALALYEKLESEKPEWHAPWKLMRVVAGHTGWVRCVAVDASNEWFATGSADRMVKVWDLASGQLKVSLTGHINAVRGLAVSERHPYLFSVGDDKMVKCWDLETNKVTRQYHGHLSGVYCCALHPTLDLLFTGSRDQTVRVWDMRTRASVFVLSGHRDTVMSVAAQAAEPQVISGSADCTVRLWDLTAGKPMAQLTHHKKQIRSVVVHPAEYTFATAGADNIKKWKCPDARFLLNFTGHNAIVNTIATNGRVLFSGADNGTMKFWDWKTGYCYQDSTTQAQPGSMAAEAGILAAAFDRTGTRLITTETDKTIKFWREDETATELSHPIANDWRVAVRQAVKI